MISMKYRKILFFFAVSSALFSLAYLPIHTFQENAHKSWIIHQHLLGDTIIIDSSNLFTTARKCEGCHGHDQLGYASVDAEGHDINLVDDWKASMMANSTRDPYWRAKVSQELLRHGQYSDVIEDKCTSCHAPLANYQSKLDGHPTFPFEHIFTDSLAMDGVSCGACHQLDPIGIGTTFSGEFRFDSTRTIYGPYTIPFGAPMSEFVGFEPVFSEHIFESEVCASCHTLVTESIDAEGNLTDETFVEQATYHEWLNSKYSQEGTSCQNCHMEYVFDPVIISTGYIFLSGRKPYALHRFQGANTFMISLINQYQDSLGLDLPDSIFQEQIEATKTFLQSKTVDLDIQQLRVEDDSIEFEIFLKNLTGHKFPSGYPARRAFLEVILSTIEHDTLFFSGKMSDDFRLTQLNTNYEPHFDQINHEHQVQVYELVPGNEFGEFTTILLRAFDPLKDNRLVPEGFLLSHESYDTVEIAGNAIYDTNFNNEGGIEGSGTDRVMYKIGLNGYKGSVNISCRMLYQSVPPEWVDELFEDEHPLINQFEEMYNTVGPAPVPITVFNIDSIPVGTVKTEDHLASNIEIYPNPLISGSKLNWVGTSSGDVFLIEIRDLDGQLLMKKRNPENDLKIELPPGVYLVIMDSTQGKRIKKLIIL